MASNFLRYSSPVLLQITRDARTVESLELIAAVLPRVLIYDGASWVIGGKGRCIVNFRVDDEPEVGYGAVDLHFGEREHGTACPEESWSGGQQYF